MMWCVCVCMLCLFDVFVCLVCDVLSDVVWFVCCLVWCGVCVVCFCSCFAIGRVLLMVFTVFVWLVCDVLCDVVWFSCG